MSEKLTIQAGKWLFRFRSFTPLPLLVVCLLFFRPQSVSGWLTPLGLLLALLGEAVRMMAVGGSYAGTSGREAHLRADKLNVTGLYSLTRNPLYIGNILIFSGLATVYGNLWVLALMVLFLALQYHLIVAAEEMYLRGKYGDEYQGYCRQVPRFLPRFHGFTPSLHPFSWKKVLLKENDSVFNLGVVAWAIVQYRVYLQNGSLRLTPAVWLPLAAWAVAYAGVKLYKKRRKPE